MSLYDIIKYLNLDNQLDDRTLMYRSIKLISNYIRGEVSKLNKSELKNLIEGLEFYLKNKSGSSNNMWNFKSGAINLDKEQIRIVMSEPNQNQRIIAGAGSGKTTTILCRIKWLLDNWICPDRILVLTFNRDSAQNIRNRVDDLFGFPVHLHIYTIDAFCCKLMYMYKLEEKSAHTKSLSEYSTIGLEIMKLYGKEISTQFTHVFFDEFQDVNDTQFHILKIFVDSGSWLTVIGDDCQNIYQFRGTNNYYMVNFDSIIPNSLTYKLTSNYRSTKSIVDMANDSISWNLNRVEKQMVAINTNTDKETIPNLIIAGTEKDKYEFVIKKISKLIESGYSYGDIAILSRNTYPLKCMETELTKNSIPHIALITDKNSDDNKRLIDPTKIALTTIHKSKGLEFTAVFLLNFSHEHFPEHLNNNIKNIEEERRLFYVGITRAKRYLYMVSSIQEIPLSVFLKETQSHFTIIYYRTEKKYKRKELFNSSDTESTLKLVYGVNELIGSLQSEDYTNLRAEQLVLEKEPEVKKIFETKLVWTNNVKKGAIEADVGEYTDRYITRGICVKLDLDFIDIDTEFIINQDLTQVRFEELEPSQNTKFFRKNQPIQNLNDITQERIKKEERVKQMVKKMMEQNLIREFTFPPNVISRIKQAYQRIQNNTQNILQDNKLEEDIYWVSLCRNFRLERTRLAYKNIFGLVKENISLKSLDKNEKYNNIQSRMDWYIDLYGTKSNGWEPKCKIFLEHKFKNMFGKNCMILGELDIMVINKNDINNASNSYTLVDFKCSESDFRLEWELQLLTYYSLIKKYNLFSSINITKLGIINLMDGMEYYFDISPSYDFEKLIGYFENKIEQDQQSIRPKPNLSMCITEHIVGSNTNSYNNTLSSKSFKSSKSSKSINSPYTYPITFNKDKVLQNDLLMVLDTETTDFVGDIIQLAWVITNPLSDYLIVKTSNKYIGSRIPSIKSTKVHKITIDKIRSDGEDFYFVMKEFIEDLEKVNGVIGHNISFDLRMITNNLRKFGVNIKNTCSKPIYDLFENLNIICTKKLSGGKSLENLHKELFNKPITDAHDALVDVKTTLECYIRLIKNQDKQLLTSTGITTESFV
jgi:DNA polymerase III epsilon subunit-like protein